MTSPFLEAPASSWVASNTLAFALRDRFPVSPGHTLVIPRRLVATWFDTTPDERAALFELVDIVKQQLDQELHPDGYNIGINAGEAAGQTVMHLHVHVIPRYRGDVDDPRGGVRHLLPGKGNYLEERPRPLATGGTDDPFLHHLAPLLDRATDAAILAAFIQESGLKLLASHVFLALARGARIRLITGDYLHITQAAALAELLDWMGGNTALPDIDAPRGTFEARVVEVSALPSPTQSFHPKSWRFEGPGFGAAFVGSSNISRAALRTGIEWNLRIDRHRDPDAFRAVADAFERCWSSARPLTADWVDEYARRAKESPFALPPGEEDEAPTERLLEPHPIQREALEQLRRGRIEEGRRRALVVLATGLGKTYLAALDVAAWASESGRAPRVLVLAHREELLFQASKTFRRVLRDPAARFGWFAGSSAELNGDVIFASVQKLSRPEHLARLSPGYFDYVIVDEVHHGTAPTYRSILERIEPSFLLGLTATPERTDGADVAGLFDDHLAYRADLGKGIAEGLLVPFAYYGLKDETNYRAIPFRNRRFDPAELERAIDTDRRLEQMWRAWQEHPGTRTLVFCCSIRHAEHARDFFQSKGVRINAVHSGPTSAPREQSLADLAAGRLDALCTVDLFNEGLDLPAVDRVVMLRPTESPVIFLQQLGRGLRVDAGKVRLTVLDFVGNHRVFLDRVRTLISLGPEPTDLRDYLGNVEAARLPPGCMVDIELEAKELLASLLPARSGSEVEQAYRDLHETRGERPTAGELYRMGYRPSTLRSGYAGWFDFVKAQGHLSEAEERVLAAAGDWLRDLETTAMSKSFKIVTLEALLEAGALFTGLSISEVARRSHSILVRSPELFRDIEDVNELKPDPRTLDLGRFTSYWKTNLIDAWTKGRDQRWFAIDGDQFIPKLPCPPGDESVLAAMTWELCDYRLAMYRARQRLEATGASFSAKIIWNKRDPILKLPSRQKNPELPKDDVDVRLPSGEVWRFRFAKEFCNVAHPVGSQRNQLPDLLRRWFGLAAGRPGTAFYVRFARSSDGLWIEPESAEGVPSSPLGTLIAFPTLRAAAGAVTNPVELPPETETVRLPMSARGEGLFAVRAEGDSMDGGERPLRDGDWLIMRFARSASYETLNNKVALLQIPDPDIGFSYHIKRLVRKGATWILRSDNPDRPSFEATHQTVPIAVLADIIRPEDIGPRPGERLDDSAVARAFGLETPLQTGRADGHLFFCLEAPGALVAPDRIRMPSLNRRPGETAYVLARPPGDAAWRYLGVARYREEEGLWACRGIDYATYRALGSSRGASRSLPSDAREQARTIVDSLLGEPGAGAFVERNGKRCRIVAQAENGGLRIDGGPGGFAERTVSLLDIAWVLLAHDDVRKHGGLLNEERVNHLRYLDGTPKSSTRWIDTGWALLLVAAAGNPDKR